MNSVVDYFGSDNDDLLNKVSQSRYIASVRKFLARNPHQCKVITDNEVYQLRPEEPPKDENSVGVLAVKTTT